jgi:hypothetical protein
MTVKISATQIRLLRKLGGICVVPSYLDFCDGSPGQELAINPRCPGIEVWSTQSRKTVARLPFAGKAGVVSRSGWINDVVMNSVFCPIDSALANEYLAITHQMITDLEKKREKPDEIIRRPTDCAYPARKR